jgi:hypothetical protein
LIDRVQGQIRLLGAVPTRIAVPQIVLEEGVQALPIEGGLIGPYFRVSHLILQVFQVRQDGPSLSDDLLARRKRLLHRRS